MPRKRKSKATESVTRAKVNFDRDSGLVLDHEEKEERINNLIKDFEKEVEVRIKLLMAHKKDSQSKITACYALELMKLPKEIKKMTIGEYLERYPKGHDVEPDVPPLDEVDEKVKEDLRTVRQLPALHTVHEEDDEGGVERTTRRKRARKPPPPPRTRFSRRLMETPASSSTMAAGLQTPLVTPKFDPRLPITPATARNPKPNEKILIMSITGSPLYVSGVHSQDSKQDFVQSIRKVDYKDIETAADPVNMPYLERLYKNLGDVLKK